MLKNLKLRSKLLLAFLAVGLIPFAVIISVFLVKGSQGMSDQAFGQLESMREVKQAQIQNLFSGLEGDMSVLMETVNTLREEALRKLISVQHIKKAQIENYFIRAGKDISILSGSEDALRLYKKLNQYQIEEELEPDEPFLIDTYEYEEIWTDIGKTLHDYVTIYGYSDVYVIDAQTWHVMYSAAKNKDLGVNLKTGPYKDSSLAELVKKVVETQKIQIEDFKRYAPLDDLPVAFIGAPMHNLGGEFLGVAVLQIPLSAVNEIMTGREGLGKTGETYLVGSDKLMRSDSFLDPKYHSVKASLENPDKGNVDTKASRDALSGKHGAGVILDYNNNLVLSSYAPVNIEGLNWAIVGEIDISEAFSPVDSDGKEFYAKYISIYGFLDLYLLNSNGFCFYTVAKNKDYQTNMLDGEYSGSGLGRLIKKVLGTQKIGFADFEPYAPLNGQPAAFIAQPVIYNDEVEAVVALRIPLQVINRIMLQRTGMGNTGETYLVGKDYLMRSDSYLDNKNHTVTASFGNPEKGKVETVSVKEALAGKTAEHIGVNYKGEPVLSAYAPVRIGDTTWALLAEKTESEAFEMIGAIKWITGITAIFCIAGIVVLALLIVRAIVRPVREVVDNLTQLSQGEGDLTTRLKISVRDEIGELANQFNAFMDQLQGMIKDIASNAATLTASSTELISISQLISDGSTQTSERANRVSKASGEMSSNMTSVAQVSDQAANNVNSIASATEEMTATVNDIASNTDQARDITNSAVDRVKRASNSVDALGEAASQISKVIEVITGISEQTNLLALNATIEAARAGEHGKGFSVVANEIKELARQTADATKDIEEKIKGIQNSTTGTVAEIEQISKVIYDVNEIVSTIATAIEEQSSTTKEIAENIAHTSKDIQSVNENVVQSSEVANGITADITDVNKAASGMADSSNKLDINANELSDLAGQLNDMVGKFRTD